MIRRQRQAGTGFFVGNNNHLINEHVVGGCTKNKTIIYCDLADKRTPSVSSSTPTRVFTWRPSD